MEFAPSILAASRILVSIPIIPAIKTMVVLPNHMRKFISAIRPLAPATSERKRYVGSPIELRRLLIGPTSENIV